MPDTNQNNRARSGNTRGGNTPSADRSAVRSAGGNRSGNGRQNPGSRKKKKSHGSGIAVVVVTVLVVGIGLLALHGHNQDKIGKGELATSETVSQTEGLANFPDLPVGGSRINITEDPALPSPSTGKDGQTSAPEGQTTQGGQVTQGGQTTQGEQPSAQSDPTSQSQKNDKNGKTTTTTTTAPVNTASEYAYAYAGFNPKPANMNVQWNLLLVNRNYILPENYKPELAEAVKGSGVQLHAKVAPEYQKMYDAAKKDGITLTPLSGYRRISTQKTNFENKIQKYVNEGYDRAEATRKAARIILPPGTSEHNAGLAMDIISLDVDFEETKEFAWLQEHAQDYGFILRYPKNKESITEITYEPWHWRYVGVDAAKAIKKSEKTLEQYLGAV